MQRVGLIMILTLVLLVAAGLFGDGFASKQTLTADQITVESERFYRFEARMELKIKVARAQAPGLDGYAGPRRPWSLEKLVCSQMGASKGPSFAHDAFA